MNETLDILECPDCGGYIDWDLNSYFANYDYSGVCEACGKSHRAPSKLVDAVIWNYKGDES